MLPLETKQIYVLALTLICLPCWLSLHPQHGNIVRHLLSTISALNAVTVTCIFHLTTESRQGGPNTWSFKWMEECSKKSRGKELVANVNVRKLSYRITERIQSKAFVYTATIYQSIHAWLDRNAIPPFPSRSMTAQETLKAFANLCP